MTRKTDKPEVGKVDRLELDIDARLTELRAEMFKGWAEGGDNIEFVACLIRAAYGRAIIDTLEDVEGMREWVKAHGYRVPSADSD